MIKKSITKINTTINSRTLLRFFSQQGKKDLPSTNVNEQLNNMLSQQEIQQQRTRRLQQLQLKHKQLQKLVDKQVKLPLKLYGTKDTYSSKYSYLTQRIMAYYRIHPTMITDYLMKIYKGSLYAMIDENQQFMNQYWQTGFKQNVLSNIKDVKKNYTLSIVEDKDFMKQMPQKCQILDAICVRGISIDRQQNQPPQNYRISEEADDVGLITYTPLYLTEDNQKFIDPKQNKKIYEGYQNMVMRVLLRIRTPLRFTVKQIPVSDQVYTWEHLVVMENQMVAPKHLQSRYKLQTLMQWLGKYRFGVWKVVDIDNFMKGNSPFRKYEKEDEFIDPIFEGTVFDRSSHSNIRKF